MDKSPDAFRTISDAAEVLDLPQHVLRFWETRFSTIKPLKRGGGRRYYRPEDVTLLKGIRHLLYDQGFTIKGVQRILKDQGVRYVIGIGEGRPIEASASLVAVDDLPEDTDFVAESAVVPETDAAVAVEGREVGAPRGLKLPSFRTPAKPAGLTAADREKLSEVLRELLDCKRLLERAREN